MSKKLSSSVLAVGVLMLLGREAKATSTQTPIFLAEIESFTLDPACTDDFCSATLVAGGETVVVPANLLIDLPANRLSARQIFDQAPVGCVDPVTGARQSGLAANDSCSGGRGGYVTLAANRTDCGVVIAGDIFIQKGLVALTGDVTYINYNEGWFRIDGVRGDATRGTMVRFNDPSSTHSIQRGAGCDGGSNCSPDPRFTNDPVNYTIGFLSGYPICIPSTVVPVDATGAPTGPRATASVADAVTGLGDAFCPDSNRPGGPDPVAADATRFAPLQLGDNVFVNGNIETINGTRFLSAHSVQVNAGLLTRDDASQPDYVQIVETVWDMPSFGRNRVRFRALGQGSLPAAAPATLGNDLDLFAARVDPRDGTNHLDPLASTFNNPGTKGLGNRPTGVNIWRIDYDVTLPPIPAKPNQPCTNLLNAGLLVGAAAAKCAGGGTLEENFSVLSPVSREIVARTRHKSAAIAAAAAGGAPVPVTLNINGAPANQGEYLRPLGISLGGLEPPAAIEFDLNLGAQPFVFEGLPWLLDRRVSPTGCPLGGCEPEGAFAYGALAAAPFPFSERQPDDIFPIVAGGLAQVPVLGRPETYFPFDAATQQFTPGVLPVPVAAACLPGQTRLKHVKGVANASPTSGDPSVSTLDPAPSAGGCAVSSTGSAWGGEAAFGLGALGLVLAGRRARKSKKSAV